MLAKRGGTGRECHNSVMLDLLQNIIFLEINLFLVFQIVKTLKVTVWIDAITAVVHSHVFFFSCSVK